MKKLFAFLIPLLFAGCMTRGRRTGTCQRRLLCRRGPIPPIRLVRGTLQRVCTRPQRRIPRARQRHQPPERSAMGRYGWREHPRLPATIHRGEGPQGRHRQHPAEIQRLLAVIPLSATTPPSARAGSRGCPPRHSPGRRAGRRGSASRYSSSRRVSCLCSRS